MESICFEWGEMQVSVEREVRDVRADGSCVMRGQVIYPQITCEGEYAGAADRFSQFYRDICTSFLDFCQQNTGKRASEEFSLSDARQRYRFFRYECKCELSPKVITLDGERLLEVSRHACLFRRDGVLWESRDSLVWRLPSLIVARDIKRP